MDAYGEIGVFGKKVKSWEIEGKWGRSVNFFSGVPPRGKGGVIMDTLGGNPFAALTAVVAPAILTNACWVLALGTSKRLARVAGWETGLTA